MLFLTGFAAFNSRRSFVYKIETSSSQQLEVSMGERDQRAIYSRYQSSIIRAGCQPLQSFHIAPKMSNFNVFGSRKFH